MAFRLIPREEKFYQDFQALGDELKNGARLLEAMLEPEHPIWSKADEINVVEHKCDSLTHAIIQRLNRTFVTPLDREDIHTLARSLDDVMDSIDASATLDPHVPPRQRPLRRARARADHHGVRRRGAPGARRPGARARGSWLTPSRSTASRTKPTASIEQAVTRLFDDERDPITVMKWKETLDFLENATDRCEDAANVLEGVMVKNG